MKKLIVLFVVLFAVASFAQSGHSAKLSWTASTDAAGNPTLSYPVYRALGACPASGVPATVTKVGTVTTTTFTDPGVVVGQTYCYYITASLNGSESSPSNTAGGTVPIAPAGGLTVTVN